MYTILVCDDERDIVSAIEIYLSAEGYKIEKAYNGREALAILAKTEVHLVLLDIMMPQMDGIATTAQIRRTSNVPIVFLSAKSESSDKILGLNIGADDYITKPFDPMELVARVRSQLRRYATLGGIVKTENVYENGGILLDDVAKTVTVDGDPVALTPIEYSMLRLFMANPGQVFSIHQIYEQVWNESPIGSENSVAVHIRHLREKIEINPSEPRYIRVVWGLGYKMEFDEDLIIPDKTLSIAQGAIAAPGWQSVVNPDSYSRAILDAMAEFYGFDLDYNQAQNLIYLINIYNHNVFDKIECDEEGYIVDRKFDISNINNLINPSIFMLDSNDENYVNSKFNVLKNILVNIDNKDELEKGVKEYFSIPENASKSAIWFNNMTNNVMLSKILETYIYEHYADNLSLEYVADKFNLSRSYLSKKFKTATGFGFKEYIINVRIQNACNLLLETNKSITDIAFECGFNDSNYFGDAFRKAKGISPHKYRKNETF